MAREATVIRLVRRYRAALLRRDARAVAMLRRDHDRLLTVITREADALAARIAAARAAGEAVLPSWLHTAGRLDELAAQVGAEVATFARAAAPVLTGAIADAAALGQRAAGQAVVTATGAVSPPLVAATLPSGALQGAAAITARGTPVGTILNEMGGRAAGELRETLLRGIALGEAPERTARRMVAVAADAPLARARVVARTETLRAYRSANVATFRAAPQVSGWVWIADFGSACAACAAMHGQTFPDTEELESHPNCRCVPAPLVPGQDPLVEPGESALLGLSESDLADRFGPGKAAALKDGRIIPRDLVGVRTSPVWGVTRSEASLSGALRNAAARRAGVA